MAKKKKVKSLGEIKVMLKNIKELNGKSQKVNVDIKSNGMADSENPAFYGALLENGGNNFRGTGREYDFIKPSLEEFDATIKNSEDMKEFLKIAKADGKRRGKQEMANASEFYGQKAVHKVQEYMLYETPQYANRGHDNPSLIDTGLLFDSIRYTVEDSKGKILRRGQ